MNRKVLLAAAGGIVATAVLLAVVVPLLIPTGALRIEIESRVGRQTGRAFKINGSLSFTVFPSLGLSARDVTLANLPGGHAPNLLRIDDMRIAVKLLPLLAGRVEVDRIVLEKPAIALEVARDGSTNWSLTAAGSPASHLNAPQGATFSGLVIRDGTLSYDNERANSHRAIAALNADVSLTTLDAPASASGDFVFRGRKLAYTLDAGALRSLLEDRTAHLRVTLSSDLLHASFEGSATRDGMLDGALTLATPSLKDVAAWLGHPVSAGHGLGPLDLKAQVKARDRDITIALAPARIDGMTASGALVADLRGDVPAVTGTLSFDRLDLNPYLSSGAASSAPHDAGTGWSRTPIPLDLLKLLDARLTVNAGGLALRHLKLGKTTMVAVLDHRRLTAHLGPMQLYGGSGQADLAIDASGAVPHIANKLAFAGIAMAPFLADAIGVDKIEGRGTIALDVASQGTSPDAIMRSLSGKGTVAIAPGAIHGVDLGLVARTVTSILSAGATGEGANTAFDRFGGSFVIANGMLTNNDLKMTGGFINMTGRGQIDLGNQTIAYRIEPKAAIGGRMHLLDIGVPFAVTGSWRHVKYVPDIAGTITGLVTGVIGAGAAPIEGLLGGLAPGQTSATPPDRKNKKKNLGDTLKNMFGLH